MDRDKRAGWAVGWEVPVGGLLLLLGLLFLLGQLLGVDLGRVGWPFFVIVPGLVLAGLGLAVGGLFGEVLAMTGGSVTAAGLVLLFQNATGRFETWAYAWTLVLLVGSGAGRWLLGLARGDRELAATGGRLVVVGLAAFAVAAVFFEVVIGIGGRRYGTVNRYALPGLLIVAGTALLARRGLAGRRP
jgi:hypothetical protein